MIELKVQTDGDYVSGIATLSTGSDPMRNRFEISIDVSSKTTDLSEVKRGAAKKFRQIISRLSAELDKEFPE